MGGFTADTNAIPDHDKSKCRLGDTILARGSSNAYRRGARSPCRLIQVHAARPEAAASTLVVASIPLVAMVHNSLAFPADSGRQPPEGGTTGTRGFEGRGTRAPVPPPSSLISVPICFPCQTFPVLPSIGEDVSHDDTGVREGDPWANPRLQALRMCSVPNKLCPLRLGTGRNLADQSAKQSQFWLPAMAQLPGSRCADSTRKESYGGPTKLTSRDSDCLAIRSHLVKERHKLL